MRYTWDTPIENRSTLDSRHAMAANAREATSEVPYNARSLVRCDRGPARRSARRSADPAHPQPTCPDTPPYCNQCILSQLNTLNVLCTAVYQNAKRRGKHTYSTYNMEAYCRRCRHEHAFLRATPLVRRPPPDCSPQHLVAPYSCMYRRTAIQREDIHTSAINGTMRDSRRLAAMCLTSC